MGKKKGGAGLSLMAVAQGEKGEKRGRVAGGVIAPQK